MDFTNDLIGESITQEDMIDAMAESLDDISVQALYDALPQFIQERLDDLAYDVKTKADKVYKMRYISFSSLILSNCISS